MEFAQYLERLVRAVWQRHYQVPEWAYWLALGGVGTLTVVGDTSTADLAGLAVMLLAAVGVGRWHVDRRRCRGALVVPRFREGGGTEGHADEAQRILVDQLWNSLQPEMHAFVQTIPATVGGDEVAFAVKLQRRLRSSFVLHGRLAARPEGGWSVLPRLLEADSGSMHYDLFTKDITPARASFGPIVLRLPPEHGVRDKEFPFEFAKDLEALTRSIAGLVAALMCDYERAVKLLDEAVAVAGDSASWLVDSLRVSLARAHANNGDVEAGLALLRPRVHGDEPSPHLLRGYAFLLSRGGKADEAEDEAEAVLRRALEVKTDPQRDQTVHNLMSMLSSPARAGANEEETEELLQQLLHSPSNYRKTWYIKRTLGLNAWLRAAEAWGENDRTLAKTEARVAAKWYRRAFRARPRLQIEHLQWSPPFVFYKRFQPSLVMRANLRDARSLAEQHLRAIWHERRFQKLRNKQMKTAFTAFAAEDWKRAFAYFDWSVVGRNDNYESIASVHTAVSLWLMGDKEMAETTWEQALAANPFALIIRGGLVEHLAELGYEDPVPGAEPTDLEAIKELAPELFNADPDGEA